MIHGTNSPSTIGQWASHGCIRLYPEDIKALFAVTKIGTKITVINTRYKLGWRDNELMIEINPAIPVKAQAMPDLDIDTVTKAIIDYAGSRMVEIDTKSLALALEQNTGLPTVIAKAHYTKPIE